MFLQWNVMYTIDVGGWSWHLGVNGFAAGLALSLFAFEFSVSALFKETARDSRHAARSVA
jgi:hypothetical protein